MRNLIIALSVVVIAMTVTVADARANHGADAPASWSVAWPDTDFDTASVDLTEIQSGGPPKNGIPPIYDPVFAPVGAVDNLTDTEPVVGITVDGETRAYPLRILMWHEIVNDTLGGIPIAVTFCPLCNTSIVFDRRVAMPDGQTETLAFGTTGNLLKSNLVMWDDKTESWWQQFLGEGIVGALTGTLLKTLPSRLESWAEFKARAGTDAMVLVPNNPNMRRYGANPYRSYDSLPTPFLYAGQLPDNVAALSRVVSLEARDRAWSFDLLRRVGTVTTQDGVVLTWRTGQTSALDTAIISEGKDVGTVTATKNGEDVAYFVDFAFAFFAFNPEAPILIEQ